MTLLTPTVGNYDNLIIDIPGIKLGVTSVKPADTLTNSSDPK